MLSQSQEKLIRSLHNKKGRDASGLCLVEGRKVVRVATEARAVEFSFTSKDSRDFAALVTTETPQDIAAVARCPQWDDADIQRAPTLVVLDGVQDPGNVGTIVRLCLGFDAALVLVESADAASPKVVRSSVGAVFQVPSLPMTRADAEEYVASFADERPVFRLEKVSGGVGVDAARAQKQQKIIVIAGSEGKGIRMSAPGISLVIAHSQALESLNVAQAVGIVLHERYNRGILQK